MRFCYGTCEAIIDFGKRVKNVWEIRSAAAQTVAPNAFDGLSDRQNKLSDLARGRDDLLGEMVKTASEKAPSEIAILFRDKVINLLDDTKLEIIILALQHLIESDGDIPGNTVVDVVNGITKDQFLKGKCFVFYRTLAGLYIYAVRRNNNLGCCDDVDKMKKPFFEQFKEKRDSISLVPGDDSISSDQMQDLLTDVERALVRSQNHDICPECGRPFIRPNEEGQYVDLIEFVTDEHGTSIPLCVECRKKLTSNSEARISQIGQAQINLRENVKLIDISSSEAPLRREVEAALKAISTMDTSEATTLRHDPKTIAEKIPNEKLFCAKVTGLVNPTYEGVQTILNSLAGQNLINEERLGRQIKRMWENTIGSPATQSAVFNSLVEIIDAKSGRLYHEACEVLISYYVQRCDVFAPAQ